MTRQEIKAYIRQLNDDVNGGYFTDTVLNPFINRAQIELQKKLIQSGEFYYLKTVQTSTAEDQSDYVIPTDFLKVHRLELVLSGTGPNEDRLQLQPMTLNQQNMITNQIGTPQNYILKRNRFVLFPTPDEALVLRLYYSYLVSNLTSDTEEVDGPVEYHDYVALYAARLCRIKDGADYADLDSEIAKYDVLFKQSAEDRKEDAPRMVVVTSQDWFPGGL